MMLATMAQASPSWMCHAPTFPVMCVFIQWLIRAPRPFHANTDAGTGNPLRPGNSGPGVRALSIFNHNRSILRRCSSSA